MKPRIFPAFVRCLAAAVLAFGLATHAVSSPARERSERAEGMSESVTKIDWRGGWAPKRVGWGGASLMVAPGALAPTSMSPPVNSSSVVCRRGF